MSEVVSFIVRMRFASEDRSEITGFMQQLTAASRKEPGCLTYIPHWIEGENDTLLIYEQYRDHEALEAHRATAHFQRWAVGGLYQRMRERSVEDLHAIA